LAIKGIINEIFYCIIIIADVLQHFLSKSTLHFSIWGLNVHDQWR